MVKDDRIMHGLFRRGEVLDGLQWLQNFTHEDHRFWIKKLYKKHYGDSYASRRLVLCPASRSVEWIQIKFVNEDSDIVLWPRCLGELSGLWWREWHGEGRYHRMQGIRYPEDFCWEEFLDTQGTAKKLFESIEKGTEKWVSDFSKVLTDLGFQVDKWGNFFIFEDDEAGY